MGSIKLLGKSDTKELLELEKTVQQKIIQLNPTLGHQFLIPFSHSDLKNINNKKRFYHLGMFTHENNLIGAVQFKKSTLDMPEFPDFVYDCEKLGMSTHALILPKYWSQGILTDLKETGMEKMWQDGYDRIVSWCHADNKKMQKQYNRNGYVKFFQGLLEHKDTSRPVFVYKCDRNI